MIFKITTVLGLSVISGILYRLGGKGGFKNAKLIRRLGCPFTALVTFIYLQPVWSWQLGVACFVSYLFMYGAMTTYWDNWASEGIEWFEWALTSLVYGLSAIPIVWITGNWFGFGLRCLTLVVTITAWSQYFSNVVIEENGRGFLFTASIPLLFLS